MLVNLKRNKEKNTEKKPISKQKIFTIIAATFLVLTHIAVILAIILSFRYYAIYPSLFGSIVGIVICLLIIIDIIFFVGFNHKDLALKIISLVLSVFIFIGGTVGTVLIAKTNGIVDNVLDSSETKYETFSGVFVCYDKYNKFEKIEDLKNKKVGMLAETSNGISYIAKDILESAKIEYAAVDTFKTNNELVTALIDNRVDAIVITPAYREIYSLERDENSPFASYLDKFIDFNQFEKELKVDNGKKAKNLNTDPFTVLLIGYSRTDIGSPIGLADSIILASINPQTYTVSMMSIARDSFVPIPCYGGEYDKINSGRSTSRACFIDTVEDFINTGRSEKDHIDIDYYMELDYLGLVYIVNTIGGITVNNPVDFELDGIFVPAGENVFCDGMMALEFCRERHHMPNGDFDRQQHQKEVIIEIAKKFVQSGDITLALDAMDAASQWMSTDLTLNQLTTVFNLLLNTKNYTSLNTFSLVDFQTLRMTGDGGLKYYSYSMNLPLWVYLIYQGSFDESIQHMDEVLGTTKTIKQDKNFEFSSKYLYDRPLFYSLEYEDKFMFTPDPMPAYWINFEGMTLQEATAWANENGVKISGISYITFGDPQYKAELEGKICDQSVRYGSLISQYKDCQVTIMGASEIDESKMVPDFVGQNYSKAVKWAENYNVPYSIDFNTSVSGEVGKVVEQTPIPYTAIEECEKLKIVVKAGSYTIKFDKNGHGGTVPENITVKTGDNEVMFKSMASTDDYIFDGWYTSANGGTLVESTYDVVGNNGSTVTVYAHWTKDITITLNPNGGTCKVSSVKPSDTLPTPTKDESVFKGWFTAESGGSQVTDLSKLTDSTTLYAHWEKCNHTYGQPVVTPATCTADGEKVEICTVCGHREVTVIPALGHDYSVNDMDSLEATCDAPGYTSGTKCSRCGEKDPNRYIAPDPSKCEIEPPEEETE